MFAKLKNRVKDKIAEIKMALALKWSKDYGYQMVRIVRRGNSDYLVTPKGQMFKIGAK